MKTIIATTQAPAAVGPYSQAVRVGETLYCSGQIALDTSGTVVGSTIEEQIHQIFSNIKALLADQGMTLDHVVKASCFLSDLNNYAAFNAVYGTYFTQQPPARSTFQVAKLPLGVLVEIEVIAVVSAA